MKTVRLISGGLVCLFVLFGMLSAGAADLSVDCDNSESLQAAIDSLAWVPGPNSISVTGTCTENISIDRYDHLTIAAPEGQMATIQPSTGRPMNITKSTDVNLYRLTLSGGGRALQVGDNSSVYMENCTIENATGAGIYADDSHLTLYRVTSHNNGRYGLNAMGSTVIVWGGLHIENNGMGLRLASDSYGFLQGYPAEDANVIQNNGWGIVLNYASTLWLYCQNDILNNGNLGMQVFGGSSAVIADDVDEEGNWLVNRIEGHTDYGINVMGGSILVAGQNRIRFNGSSGIAEAAGIHLSDGGTALLQYDDVTLPGPQITDNYGPGILLEMNASMETYGATISNNGGGGINLMALSAAKFWEGNNVSGNGGGGLTCDTTSVAYGDLSGISPIQCGGGTKGGGKHKSTGRRIKN